jgi:hypothetical protein
MWRMASSGLDTLREVVVRSSQSGRLRVDLALLQRERQQLYRELGMKVADLIEEGTIEAPDELRRAVERIRDVEARIEADSSKAHDNAFGAQRGYEPEAGNYEDELDPPDEDEADEHAQVATPGRKGDSR